MIKRALKHLSRTSDVFFRKLKIERDITVYADDIFLTSYPRSGNTWTRFLVGNLVHQDEAVTFANLEQLVPDMYVHSDHEMRQLPRPRILKSHECFDPRYKRVVYIVRDPRDVAVSNYHWELKKGSFPDGLPMQEFVPRWMESLYWPRLGCWSDHIISWLSTRRGGENFVLVRYEDLMGNTERELARIAGVLGVQPTAERLRRAVDLSSADRMRQLENREGDKWVQTRYTRQDKPFVRRASSGTWKTALPPQSVALIESAWGHLMNDLGYELTSQPLVEATRN
ncbi:MAG: sulfotransferase domain-containing protein [Acidobacteria bacterium]|nr:sulfotransferase domain-containing protein [Acidobacteriota bacterium]MBV8890879.1 sulfotransferase domain-containing protein [Acidobacteriota bacterium]MBV9483078.1 sulfotransferase domain-containing protein [Acidobacteriota bacterium]